MILEKIEILNEITEEKKKELLEKVKQSLNKTHCITIECYAGMDGLFDIIPYSKAITALINDINTKMYAIYALLIDSSIEGNSIRAEIKLHDKEPSISRNLVI